MKIKPTGLKGNDKIQRIQNLMGRMNSLNESTTNSSLEHVKYGADGIAYAIVRESHTYFIKTSDKKDKNLIVDDFDYVGGLQNKMSESYKSYEDALRHLNMKFKDLNESYGIRENIDLFRSDILTETTKKGEVKMDEQEEETKFKLKVDAPEAAPVEIPTEVPSTEVTTDIPMDTTSEVPTEEPIETPEETEIPSDDSNEEESGDLEKDIQRLTGKIGQKMRELDEPNPELEKYVINSIISALDVDSMDEDFKEDLITKLEGEGEESEEEKPEETEIEATSTEEETPETEETSTEEESEEVKTESRIISKKTLLENLKKKKLSEQRYRDFEDEEYKPLRFKKRHKFDFDDEELLDEETVEVFTPEQLVAKLNSPTPPKGNVVVKDKTGRMKGINFNEQEEDEIEETIYEIELDEDWMEEGNKFTKMLAKTKKGGTFKIGDREYKDTSSYDYHKSKHESMDEDMDFEFDKEELKPLHRKPFDLKSVKKKEEELDEDFDLDFYTDKDDNDIADQLEIKSNKPTIAPPPVKTPTPTTPRRDRPFKPQIKPKIQPKGYRD